MEKETLKYFGEYYPYQEGDEEDKKSAKDYLLK
jgi:hypothetical protein